MCDCLYRSDQLSGSALLRHGQAFLPGANAIDRDEAFGNRRVKTGGALECRATGVIEKLGPLLTSSSPKSPRPFAGGPSKPPAARFPSLIVLVVVVVLVLGCFPVARANLRRLQLAPIPDRR